MQAPLSWLLLLLLSLQVAVPAGALAETLLDAPGARGAHTHMHMSTQKHPTKIKLILKHSKSIF